MIAELGAYESYKVCKNSSLVRVPAHWRIVRMKSVMHESERRTKDGRGVLLSLSRTRGLIDRTKMTDKAPSARTLVGYKLYRPGQIVMNRMQAWTGMFGAGRISGLVSPDYAVYSIAGGENATFLLARLKCHDLVAEYRIESKGIGTGFNRLYNDRFGGIRISLPPSDEQELIVRFLDWASVRLGKAIAAKRKVIGLLEEQKQAIIHRAVTRGLDDSVSLKPSGLDWLGDVPEHWEIRRSKYVYREVDERSKDGNEVHLSMSQKHGLVPSSQIEERRLMSDSYAGGKLCRVDDLVLNRLKAHLGVFALATTDGVISPDYTVLRSVKSICNKYFELLYKNPACRRELFVRAKGIVQGFWRLYTDDFYAIQVPVPPLQEQYRIVESIEAQTDGVNKSIGSAQKEIGLFQEYRTRLIADVVTGKLDVREFARTLPADVAEEAAELACSELGDEFSDTDDELDDELAGEPA